MIVPLSKRELSVVALVAEGKTNSDIAKQLVLSRRTVELYLGDIYGKLDLSTEGPAAKRVKLVNWWNEQS